MVERKEKGNIRMPYIISLQRMAESQEVKHANDEYWLLERVVDLYA